MICDGSVGKTAISETASFMNIVTWDVGVPQDSDHTFVPDVPSLGRRKMLGALGAGGAAGLAGCSTSQGGSSPTDTPTDSPTQTAPPQTQKTPTATKYEKLSVGGDLVVSSTSTPSGLNPLRVNDTTTGFRIGLMLDGGGGAYDRETFLPRWFKSWELADSNDVVEYTLHEGLQFGDPENKLDSAELTAEDYVYFLNELALLTGDKDWYGYADTNQYQIGPKGELISYEKTGKYSFRAELPVTKPTWLHEDPLPGAYVLPKDFIKPYREKEDAKGLDKDPYVTEAQYGKGDGNLGRYQFVNWKRDSQMEFTRNPNWYAREKIGQFRAVDYSKAPYFNSVTIQQFKESATQLSALKSGEIAWAGISSSKVPNFRGKDNDGIDLYLSPFDNSVFWLNINHRINGWEALRNSPNHNHNARKVRYAIGNVYDPNTLIKEAHNGLGNRIKTLHARWGPYYPPEEKLPDVLSGSLEKARQLLKEGTSSEYGYNSNGEFVGPDGEQLQLRGVRTTGNPSIEIEANFVKSRLEQLGIKYSLEAVQWASLLRNYAQNSVKNVDGVSKSDLPSWAPASSFNGGPWDKAASKKDWDLMHGLGFSTTPYAPWGTVKVTMGEDQQFNLWGYHQDQIDFAERIGELSTASSQQKIQKGLTNIFAFLAQDQPLIFKYTPAGVTGYRNRIAGQVGERNVDGYDFKAQGYWQDVVFDDPYTLYAFEDDYLKNQ